MRTVIVAPLIVRDGGIIPGGLNNTVQRQGAPSIFKEDALALLGTLINLCKAAANLIKKGFGDLGHRHIL